VIVTDVSEKLAGLTFRRFFLDYFQDGSNNLIRNVGSYLPVYTASCARRLESPRATQNPTANLS
jgi:hypothetical protein